MGVHECYKLPDYPPVVSAYHVFSGVRLREHFPSRGGAQFEPWYDGHRAYLLCPPKAHIMTDPRRRRWRIAAPVGASIGRIFRKDLAQRDARGLGCTGIELAQVGAYEASDERRGNVVRMALNHERIVEHSLSRETKVPECITQEDTRDHRRAGGSEPATERDLVVHAEGQARGEGLDAVRAQDVKRDARGEIFVCVERDFVCAFAGVRDGGPFWCRRGCRGAGGHCRRESKGEREGEADDIKARTDVGRCCGNAYLEGS